jgi:hypothetical protein
MLLLEIWKKRLDSKELIDKQISESDTKKIYGIVSALGGQYRFKIEQDVTHLITLDCKGVMFLFAL